MGERACSDLPVGGYTVIIVGKAWTPDMEALGHTTPVVRRQRLGRKGAELKKTKNKKKSKNLKACPCDPQDLPQ